MRLALIASSSDGEKSGFAEYIAHHLQHLASKKQTSMLDFSVVHWDTVFFSLLCAAAVLLFLRRASSRATADVPGKFQSFVEMLVEWIHGEAKAMVNGPIDYVAPLALTVFCWVVLMNAIDLLPVDLLPRIGHSQFVGATHLRPLPTADLNATLGMAIGVLFLATYYGIKVKGLGGWAHEFAAGHFGAVKPTWNPLTWVAAILLLVANLFFGLEGVIAPTISHGFRLYGNMYAGELIFFLIAGLGGTGTVFGTALQLIVGTAWALFHILVVLLQAYVFMMLTLVYIGRAYDHH